MSGHTRRVEVGSDETYVEIVLLPLLVCALRHDSDAPCHMPTEDDLAGGRLVLFRELSDRRVGENGLVA